jgi:hypothetical protein
VKTKNETKNECQIETLNNDYNKYI